jgi:hypothetical protein
MIFPVFLAGEFRCTLKEKICNGRMQPRIGGEGGSMHLKGAWQPGGDIIVQEQRGFAVKRPIQQFKDGSATGRECLSSISLASPIIAALQLVSRPAGGLPRPFWHR